MSKHFLIISTLWCKAWESQNSFINFPLSDYFAICSLWRPTSFTTTLPWKPSKEIPGKLRSPCWKICLNECWRLISWSWNLSCVLKVWGNICWSTYQHNMNNRACFRSQTHFISTPRGSKNLQIQVSDIYSLGCFGLYEFIESSMSIKQILHQVAKYTQCQSQSWDASKS